MARSAGTTAGWFADPAGRFRFRYWDGNGWSDQVLDGTSREERTDALEPALAAFPPRPALPTLPGAGAGDRVSAGATVVGPPLATDAGWGSAPRRIPRPPRLLIVLVVLAVSVGGGVLLVSKLDDATNRSSASAQFFGGPSGPPISGVVSSPSAVDGGVIFTNDAAPTGYHRTNVEGLSVALPTEWVAMLPNSRAFQVVREQSNLDPDSAAVARLRLYADDPLDPSVTMVVTVDPVGRSLLDRPQAVAEALRNSDAVVPNSVKVSTVQVDGRRALRIDAEALLHGRDGRSESNTQQYLFADPKGGLVQLTFFGSTDRASDQFSAIVDSIHRTH